MLSVSKILAILSNCTEKSLHFSVLVIDLHLWAGHAAGAYFTLQSMRYRGHDINALEARWLLHWNELNLSLLLNVINKKVDYHSYLYTMFLSFFFMYTDLMYYDTDLMYYL